MKNTLKKNYWFRDFFLGRGKFFQLNIIISLIWDFFFQMVISLLIYVATFSEQFRFRRNDFFTLFQSNYFDTTVTFSEQLFLQSSCVFGELLFQNNHFFRSSCFFRTATFLERIFYRAGFFENRKFFRTVTFWNGYLFGRLIV